jgi:M6 family metalloprotease-like protein
MKQKYFYIPFILLFLFLIPQRGQAEPAHPYPVQYKLPDGSFITITLKGDEHVSWALSPDGYTLLVNLEGYYEYAAKDTGGELVLSGIRAHNPEDRTAGETAYLGKTPKDIRYNTRQIEVLRSVLDMQTQLRSLGQTAVATTGVVRTPLILVAFKDKPFTRSKEEFELLINQPNYTATADGPISGSVHDYYHDNSYGKLNYQVDVFGPYTLTNNIAYYDYKSNGNQYYLMPSEAWQQLTADPAYHASNYPNLETVHIIFAGYSQAAGAPAGESIWSHAASFTSGGKTLRYSCSNELVGNSGTQITSIGVIAHELGHVFGLPDLYDTDYAEGGGESVHIGAWDIMATGGQNNGGRTPANFSAYSKDFLGWKPATVLNAAANIFLPNPAVKDTTYRINTTTNNEYFLLENRQRTGWDAYIPASGMLIYHVDKNYSGWNNGKVNANPAHRGLYIKQAGGSAGSNSTTRTTDPYPSSGNAEFTDTSTPNSKSWAGSNTAKPITNIVHDIEKRTIFFSFMGGSDKDKWIETQAHPSYAGTIQGEEKYYPEGTTVTFTAIPALGYRFSKWVNGNTVSTENPYSFQVTDNVTLIAEFLPFEILENFFTEDFENNTSAWTFVNNAQTNQWIIGSTIVHSGSKSAYISNNGTAYSYTLAQASTVHLYRDIAFPVLSAGHFRLDFDWKGKGEYPGGNEVDYMEVHIIETSQTPEAGAALSDATLLGKFFGADWQHAEIILPRNYAEASQRLVFTWINNESGGNQPPIAIDNVALNRVQPVEFSDLSFSKKHNDIQPVTVSFAGIDDTWLASAPDWITLNPSEGNINDASGQFTFSCMENDENSAREGFITVHVNDKTFNLKVMQAGIAPSGLEAIHNNTTQSVKLTWDPLVSEPVESGEDTLKWHNGASGSLVGFIPREYIEAAIRFTPKELAPYHGTKIRALEIYAGMTGVDMKVNIRQDGQLIYSQPITGLQPNRFVRVDLEKSISFDITKDLYAGFSYTQRFGTSNNTVLSRDTGPVIADKNYQSFDQGTTFTPISSNWNIAMIVSHDATPVYHVYRDGERIAEAINAAAFEDLHPPVNTNTCYTVSAVYNGKAELESIGSDTACVCVEVTGVENIFQNSQSLFDVYTKDNIPTACNYAEYPAIVSLYGISGQLLYSTTLEAGETKYLDINLTRGVYIAKASYKGSGNSIKKIVVQ